MGTANVSEPHEALVPYSITPPPVLGGVICPKAGYVVLTSDRGQKGAYRTICKSWSCRVCQKKKKSLFIEMVKHGCSVLGRCYSITLTFKMGLGEQRDARSAEGALRAFFRRLRRLYPNLQYLKVLEMTKKNQPHYHPHACPVHIND